MSNSLIIHQIEKQKKQMETKVNSPQMYKKQRRLIFLSIDKSFKKRPLRRLHTFNVTASPAEYRTHRPVSICFLLFICSLARSSVLGLLPFPRSGSGLTVFARWDNPRLGYLQTSIRLSDWCIPESEEIFLNLTKNNVQ